MSDFLVTNPIGVVILAVIGMIIYDLAKRLLPRLFKRDEAASIRKEVTFIERAISDYNRNVHVLRMVYYSSICIFYGIMLAIVYVMFAYSASNPGYELSFYGLKIGLVQLCVQVLMYYGVIRFMMAGQRMARYSSVLLSPTKTNDRLKHLFANTAHLDNLGIDFPKILLRYGSISMER